MTNNKTHKLSFLNRSSGIQKLMICVGMAIGFFFILLFFNSDKLIKNIMFSWDFFCLSMIIISWIIFITTSGDQLYLLAKNQDESLPVIFIIVVVTVCFSLFGTVILIINKDINSSVISLIGVGLSWLLLHTIFTTRYAHLYYDRKDRNSSAHKGGLEFPNEKVPDYIDFAYFSFVIGMTFQVSDVQVTSRKIRLLVLVHGLISFVFNAIIVALTISIIANLKQ